jgi:hypothetical protein
MLLTFSPLRRGAALMDEIHEFNVDVDVDVDVVAMFMGGRTVGRGDQSVRENLVV